MIDTVICLTAYIILKITTVQQFTLDYITVKTFVKYRICWKRSKCE